MAQCGRDWWKGQAIFDAAGRLTRRLHDGPQEAGEHRLYWDGCNAAGRPVPRGVYFVRLAAGGKHLARKVIMTR